jgi:hypothetical protein
MKAVNWDDHVLVQILDPKLERERILWVGITLAEAVQHWLGLPPEDQTLVVIFGTEIFVGREIADLAKREDFPKPSVD